MTSISALAEQAVQEILEAGENGPRSSHYKMTLLNRKHRVLRGIRRRYEQAAWKLGQSKEATQQQWLDIRELAELEARADLESDE